MKVYPLLNPELLIICYQNQNLLLDTGGSNSLAHHRQVHFEGIHLLDTAENKLLSSFVFPTIYEMVKQHTDIEIHGLVGNDILKEFYLMSDLKRGLVGFSKRSPAVEIQAIESSFAHFLTASIPVFHLSINQQKYCCIYDTGAHIGFSTILIPNGEKSEIVDDFSPMIGSFKTQTYLYDAKIKAISKDHSLHQDEYPLKNLQIGDLNTSVVHKAISMPLLGSGIDLMKVQIHLLNSQVVLGSALVKQYTITTLPVQYTDENAPALAVIKENVHDGFAKHYDASYLDLFGHYFTQISNRLIDELKQLLKPNHKFLDVGAGTGRIALALQNHCQCTLVEPSLGMISQAIEKSDKNQKSTNFYFGVLDEKFEQTYPHEKFDLIFLGMGVVDYLSDEALQQLHLSASRLLAPNGYLLIQPTPTAYYQDTHLVGQKYERSLIFDQKLDQHSFQLKHQIKIKATGELIEENFKFYQRENTLEKDLSRFKLVKKTNDGSYQTFYFKGNAVD